jgi:type IV pilus assembly protein PilQ
MNNYKKSMQTMNKIKILNWQLNSGLLITMIAMVLMQTSVFAANNLENISFASMPGDKIQIKLEFSQAAPEPELFTIDVPARIVLDFNNINLKTKNKKVNIGVGAARSVKAVESQGRTRVVVNMVSLPKYSTKIKDNVLFLTLNKIGSQSSSLIDGGAAVRDIDFRRGGDGEGHVIITFSDDVADINIKDEGEKIVVNMKDVQLPRDLERRLDVTDFATPVKMIDTYAMGNQVKMIIDAQGEYDHLGYQIGNQFTIEIKELSKKEKEAKIKARFGYSGERLSLIFQDIEVRAVLQLIADFTGKNMVTSDTVTGNITLRLKNVPWDQALDIILKTKGLAMREDGNVIRVAPMEELAALEKQELEANKQIANLLPRVRETIQLNYRRASVVVTLLKSISSEEGTKNTTNADNNTPGAAGESESGASLISGNATIIGDDRTNKIIVYDTRRNITQLRKLIEEIDVPTKQVLIDSRIVSAGDTFSRDIGVTWDMFNKNDFHITSAGNAIYTGNRGQVNLGNVAASAGTLGVTTAILGGGWLVDLELQAAEVEGAAEIVSSPRVVSANGETAVIKQGVEIPYQTDGGDGGFSIAFKEAVLKLEVTPNITPNNRIEMKVSITNDSQSGTAIDGTPIIDKQELETNVIVNNGDTVVLGGVFKYSTGKNENKIPLLGDVPVIGHLFKNSAELEEKRELLIFITPKVLDTELSIRN